jgi:hypothetical protein
VAPSCTMMLWSLAEASHVDTPCGNRCPSCDVWVQGDDHRQSLSTHNMHRTYEFRFMHASAGGARHLNQVLLCPQCTPPSEVMALHIQPTRPSNKLLLIPKECSRGS